MKKTLLVLAAVSSLHMGFAQTAVNFNCSDCAGNNHDLFTELDAGKVIVICWVMPCATCINPASTDANTVLGYSSSYPGKVKFYLVDDYANTTCSTLNTWAATNGITTDAIFSNASINMVDYGIAAMPKTVVLGGSGHTVFYNQGGTVLASDLQAAINNAIATAVNGLPANVSAIAIQPNPVSSGAILSYTLTGNSAIGISVFDMVGQEVMRIPSAGSRCAGRHEMAVDFSSFENGIYFIRVNGSVMKFMVAH